MTNREQLLQELADFPDELLSQAVELLRSLKAQLKQSRSLSTPPPPSEVWASVMSHLQDPNSPEQVTRNQALKNLLQSWEDEGDDQEQTETWEFLRQALDEDRLSDRPLYP